MKFKLVDFDSLPSTNTYALENLSNLENGSVIIAEHQTHGRGRLNRSWQDEAGKNLTFSIVLKDSFLKVRHNGLLAQMAALAICKILERQVFAQNVYLKWPNDVLVDGAKVAGILAESKNGCLIIGVGINVNTDEKDFKNIDRAATSLKIADNNQHFNCREVLSLFLMQFGQLYSQLPQGFENIRREIEQRIIPRKNIVVDILDDNGLKEQGLLEGLDENGALFLLTSQGLKRFDYGEVSLRFPA